MITIRSAALAACAALVALPVSGAAQVAAPTAPPVAEAPPALSIATRTALRCSAAFALIARQQQDGGASDWPPVGTRGREFFVQAAARAMDEATLSRAQLAELMAGEAVALVRAPEDLAALRAPCTMLLEASGG